MGKGMDTAKQVNLTIDFSYSATSAFWHDNHLVVNCVIN